MQGSVNHLIGVGTLQHFCCQWELTKLRNLGFLSPFSGHTHITVLHILCVTLWCRFFVSSVPQWTISSFLIHFHTVEKQMGIMNTERLVLISVSPHFPINACACSNLDFKLLSFQRGKTNKHKRCVLAATYTSVHRGESKPLCSLGNCCWPLLEFLMV